MQLTARRLLSSFLFLVSSGRARAEPPDEPPADRAISARARLLSSVYTDSDHVTVFTPVAVMNVASPSAGVGVEAQYLADVVSAASVDVVSTASPGWREIRHAGSVTATYAPRPVTVRGNAALSTEPDYRSIAGGGSLGWEFGEKSHAASAGYTHTADTIGRAGTPFDVFSRRLDSNTGTLGVSLTLNRSTLLSLVNELSLERGNQSKPYRYVPMFAEDVAPSIERGESMQSVAESRLPAAPVESLPRSRQRFSLTAALGYRFAHATLRLEQRGYVDSWGLRATTTEARYYADVSRRLRLWPRLRLHAQSSAYFHRLAYVAERRGASLAMPRYRSGDRELGPLSTASAGVGGSFAFGRAARPETFAVTLQGDAMHTEFLDALYVTSRDAALVTVGVEGGFE